ncbi:hypothetical protein BVY02_01170 [bacterium J17]|nr:hypothetical protein BVY02_01170 [bacterium J17]
MKDFEFYVELSERLDNSGLVWHPEIGDEVTERPSYEKISILVDPSGQTVSELRKSFLWLPTVEQLVQQFEARQAIISHAGLRDDFKYETVIRAPHGVIEAAGKSLRISFGRALEELITKSSSGSIH